MSHHVIVKKFCFSVKKIFPQSKSLNWPPYRDWKAHASNLRLSSNRWILERNYAKQRGRLSDWSVQSGISLVNSLKPCQFIRIARRRLPALSQIGGWFYSFKFLVCLWIMTRFECKLLVLWILWLLLILYGGKFFNWKKIAGIDRQRYKTC